jgi:hypothetical protein
VLISDLLEAHSTRKEVSIVGNVEDDLENLHDQLRELVEEGAWGLWESLSADELLRKGLQQAVASPGVGDSVERLQECLSLLESDKVPITIKRYFHEVHRGTHVDTDRLCSNARALAATALTAAAARWALSHDGAYNQLVEAARKAVYWLTGQKLPPSAVTWIGVDAGDPAALIDHVYQRMAASGGPIAAARDWTLYWLRPAPAADAPSVCVPIAGYHGTGFLADLRLEFLTEQEDTLIAHPDIALRPLARDLLATLQTAWQLTQGAIRYRITVRDPVPSLLPLTGNSLGAAAAVGFSLLRDRRPYDPSVSSLPR